MFKKKSETVKLFYNKYLYCGHFNNPLSGILRDKSLVYAKSILDILYNTFDKENPNKSKDHLLPVWINELIDSNQLNLQHIQDASIIYKTLSNTTSEYCTRQIFQPRPYPSVIFSHVRLYTNDLELLNTLAKNVKCAYELMAPNPKDMHILANNPNSIICKNTAYKYKIRFNHNKIHPNFLPWYSNNKDKIKIPYLCLSDLRRYGRIENRFIYVKDDNTLTLLNLMIDKSISRIYECISPSTLDK